MTKTLQNSKRKKVQASTYLTVPYATRKKGILFFVGPQLLIGIVMFIWAATVYVFPDRESLLAPLQIIMGIVFLLLVIASIAGIFACVILFQRKEEISMPAYDKRSGNGEESEVPAEVKGWNWGAAFLTVIWSLYYRTWYGLLIWAPLFNLVWWLVMGLKGSEMAWRADRWESVVAFQRTQAKWKPWAIVTLVVQIIYLVILFI